MPDQNRSAFRERLGMYLLGIAIGLVMLGVIYSMRRQAATQQAPAAPAPTAPR